jgi:lipoyl synthase
MDMDNVAANGKGMSAARERDRETRRAEIRFFVPGVKHYDNRYYSNHPSSFAHLSITGDSCARRCAHCDGRLLQTMLGATSLEAMRKIIDKLLENGCRGILVSGGSDARGEVPLRDFAEGLNYAKQEGLKVLVHGGLVRRETAVRLKEAGVDQVLLDVIGDERTIREVCRLDRKPEDYLQAMLYCREAGLSIAPHVVIGLDFCRIRGELRALEMIRRADPETIVLVIVTPARGTAMAGIFPPPAAKTAEIMAAARALHPVTPIALGCMRPPGLYKRQAEIMAIDLGVNGIAYPDEATVAYAESRGLEAVFSEECCCLLGLPPVAQTESRSRCGGRGTKRSSAAARSDSPARRTSPL